MTDQTTSVWAELDFAAYEILGRISGKLNARHRRELRIEIMEHLERANRLDFEEQVEEAAEIHSVTATVDEQGRGPKHWGFDRDWILRRRPDLKTKFSIEDIAEWLEEWYPGTDIAAAARQLVQSNDGLWHHVVYVKSGSTRHIYVDGNLKSDPGDTEIIADLTWVYERVVEMLDDHEMVRSGRSTMMSAVLDRLHDVQGRLVR